MNRRAHDPEIKAKLLQELTQHPGRHRAIGMGELYEIVFSRRYEHRINDTRELRHYISALRREGVPILSCGEGYYLASSVSELDDYCRRIRLRALRVLTQEAKLRRVSLPHLLGQIQLNLRPPEVR